MSRKGSRNKRGSRWQRHISVRAVRRDQPDVRKLSRALIQLALEQAAAEAAAEAQAKKVKKQSDDGAEAADA